MGILFQFKNLLKTNYKLFSILEVYIVSNYDLFQLYSRLASDIKNNFDVLSNRYFIEYVAHDFYISLDVAKSLFILF